MISVTALMFVRNEAHGLATVLQHLFRDGLQLAVIDHSSDDGTATLLDRHADRIVARRNLPFTGVFDLAAMLEAVGDLAVGLRTDWFVLWSGDEILQSPVAGESIREGLARADRGGANVVNFDEFVFVPSSETAAHEGRDFFTEMTGYYHFAPHPLRLMRAWRADAGLRLGSAGHRLEGASLRIHPENFLLRHYPHLSLTHARRKYPTRCFAPAALARGWHHNRVGIDPMAVKLPPRDRLRHVTHPDDRGLDTSDPWREHYWESARRPAQ